LYHHDSPELRYGIDRVVRPLLAEEISATMPGCRVFIASLLVKYPGADGYLQLHQDWSFVDEERFVSGVIWLPLEPTTAANGGLGIVPGSHRLDTPDRGIHPWAPQLEVVEDLLRDHLVQLDTQPGQAVVFQKRVVHASSANGSDHPRVVVGIGIVSNDADLYHYLVDDDEQMWRFTVSDQFFFEYMPGDPPGAGVVDSQPWVPRHRVLEPADLAALGGRRPVLARR
jgi:hypothetical protein